MIPLQLFQILIKPGKGTAFPYTVQTSYALSYYGKEAGKAKQPRSRHHVSKGQVKPQTVEAASRWASELLSMESTSVTLAQGYKYTQQHRTAHIKTSKAVRLVMCTVSP